MFFPSWLEYLPLGYMQFLLKISNVSLPNFYAVLDLAEGASRTLIASQYRKLARTCHPDKIPAGIREEDRLALIEKFTRIGEANEYLSRDRSLGEPELKELLPRCTAAAFLCFYWCVHMSMDFMEVETQSHKAGEELRNTIANTDQSQLHLNLDVIGCTREELTQYCKSEESKYSLPLIQHNNLEVAPQP